MPGIGIGAPLHARKEYMEQRARNNMMPNDNDDPEKESDRLRKVGIAIWNELNSLQKEWDLFQAIFMHSEERTDVLNRCLRIPTCGEVLNKALQRDIILRVARLGDPPGRGEQQNICFGAIKEFMIATDASNKIFDGWDALTHRVSVKSMRDTMIAHLDSGVRFGDRECAAVEFRQVERAIQHMNCTLMRLSDYYSWNLSNWDENTISDEIDDLLKRMTSC